LRYRNCFKDDDKESLAYGAGNKAFMEPLRRGSGYTVEATRDKKKIHLKYCLFVLLIGNALMYEGSLRYSHH
jgi:hypothetical protein